VGVGAARVGRGVGGALVGEEPLEAGAVDGHGGNLSTAA
jgi:hypothetical protein